MRSESVVDNEILEVEVADVGRGGGGCAGAGGGGRVGSGRGRLGGERRRPWELLPAPQHVLLDLRLARTEFAATETVQNFYTTLKL